MSNQIVSCDFHGRALTLVEHDGAPFVVMKAIVEALNLDWGSQHAKLTNGDRPWGIRRIAIPSAGGPQGMVCLPLRKLTGWLYTISPAKVKPELRDTLISFQEECDDVLWAYWSGQRDQLAEPAGAEFVVVEEPALAAPVAAAPTLSDADAGLVAEAAGLRLRLSTEVAQLFDLIGEGERCRAEIAKLSRRAEWAEARLGASEHKRRRLVAFLLESRPRWSRLYHHLVAGRLEFELPRLVGASRRETDRAVGEMANCGILVQGEGQTRGLWRAATQSDLI